MTQVLHRPDSIFEPVGKGQPIPGVMTPSTSVENVAQVISRESSVARPLSPPLSERSIEVVVQPKMPETGFDGEKAATVVEDAFGLTTKVVDLINGVRPSDCLRGCDVLDLASLTDLYTGTVKISGAVDMIKEARKVDEVRYEAIGAVNASKGALMTLDALLIIPVTTLKLLKSNAPAIMKALKGMGTALKATSFVGSILSAIPKVFEIHETYRLTSEVSKRLDVGDEGGALDYLKGLVTLGSLDVAKVIEKHGKITPEQLEKLEIDGGYIAQINQHEGLTEPDKDFLVRELTLRSCSFEPVGSRQKFREHLAMQLLQALDKKRYQVKEALGTRVHDALVADVMGTEKIEDVSVFVSRVMRHAHKKQLLNGFMLVATAMMFIATVLSSLGGPAVGLAGQVLSLASAVIWLLVDIYLFKNDVVDKKEDLKERAIMLMLNLVILGTVIAATVTTGGVGLIATSATVAGIMMAVNLYIVYKTRKNATHGIQRESSDFGNPLEGGAGAESV